MRYPHVRKALLAGTAKVTFSHWAGRWLGRMKEKVRVHQSKNLRRAGWEAGGTSDLHPWGGLCSSTTPWGQGAAQARSWPGWHTNVQEALGLDLALCCWQESQNSPNPRVSKFSPLFSTSSSFFNLSPFLFGLSRRSGGCGKSRDAGVRLVWVHTSCATCDIFNLSRFCFSELSKRSDSVKCCCVNPALPRD